MTADLSSDLKVTAMAVGLAIPMAVIGLIFALVIHTSTFDGVLSAYEPERTLAGYYQ
jgi:hypothetical protein